jgi:hypothetical protein
MHKTVHTGIAQRSGPSLSSSQPQQAKNRWGTLLPRRKVRIYRRIRRRLRSRLFGIIRGNPGGH